MIADVESNNDHKTKSSVNDNNYYEKVPKNQMIFDEEFGLTTQPSVPKSLRLKRELTKVNSSLFLETIYGFIPFLKWFPNYRCRENLLNDIIGGFTVGIMLIPQGMAYASLAGVEPVYGLYTSFFPPLIYMFFGTSRHISLGVFAVVSLMVGSTNLRVTEELNRSLNSNLTHKVLLESQASLSAMAVTPIEVVTSLTLCVGIILIVMGFLKLDFLTNYMSDQIIEGFTTGAAVHVLVAQMNKIIGVPLPRHNGFGKIALTLHDLYKQWPNANTVTVVLSLTSITVLYFCKNFFGHRLRKVTTIPVPFDLVMVVSGIIISSMFRLEENYSVKVIEYIPAGFPTPTVPNVNLFTHIFGDALAIAIVVIAVTISMESILAKKHGYSIDKRQEFYAMGLTECISSFFACWTSCGALARSLIYESAGTKTQFATVFASTLILSVIFLLGRFMHQLPLCILSSIIIVALKGMFMQLRQLKALWLLSKLDFTLWLAAFLATITFDVIHGLLIGVLCSVLAVLYRTQQIKVVKIGRMSHLESAVYYRSAKLYRDAQSLDGICCLQINGPIVFFNSNKFKELCFGALVRDRKLVSREALDTIAGQSKQISHKQSASNTSQRNKFDVNVGVSKLRSTDPSNRLTSNEGECEVTELVVDLAGVPFVDTMGCKILAEIHRDGLRRGITVYYTSALGSVYEFVIRCENCKTLNLDEYFYPSVEDVVQKLKK